MARSAADITPAAKGKVAFAFVTGESSELLPYFPVAIEAGLKALIIAWKRIDSVDFPKDDLPTISIDYEQGATVRQYIVSTRYTYHFEFAWPIKYLNLHVCGVCSSKIKILFNVLGYT